MNHKAPVLKTSIPGPQSRQIVNTEHPFLAPGIQRIALLSGVAFEYGDGATLTDVDGNTYSDFFAGVTVASLGHSHSRYIAALEKQLHKLTVGNFTTEPRARLVEKIASLTPGELNRT